MSTQLCGAPAVGAPRWKQAAASALAIYPISLLGNVVLGPLLIDRHPMVRTLIFAAVFSILMTYLAVPAVNRLLRRWLQPTTC
ncbi:hypothetical protein [Nocardia brasiliensis]|uniref:hypothetical protein n=1 Tax=Nocardia brasiliensis TaxID=37326 RepID=UPI003D8C7A6B